MPDALGDDADGRVRRDGRIERRLDRGVERDLPERVDVADLARVAGRRRPATVSSPILRPISLGTKTTFAERPSTWASLVVMSSPRIWSTLPTGTPAAMASWTGGHEAGPEDRLDDDAVELARRDRVLELRRSARRDRCWRRTPAIVGAAGRGCLLGGCEHGRVVAVGDREREVRDLQWLLVLRRAPAGAVPASSSERERRGASPRSRPLPERRCPFPCAPPISRGRDLGHARRPITSA